MALKYWFEFTDVKEIVHRCEIYNDSFVGDSTQIYGNLTTNKATVKDTLETIRGGGLTINLEANLDLKFDDFYSENERTFSVKYIRDGVSEFLGWLSPEGLYESFVEDKWIISLDCTDGLGFLKNLSYVENDTGLPFIGKQSILEVIVNCLKRTNLTQNIYTYVDVIYEGQTSGTNTLAETFINANRYIKDDNNTFMNCDEVLRSLFDLFGLCITQYKGEWLIYKPNSLKDNSSLTYYGYDSDGVALSPTTKTIDLSFTLGSQINNFYPHHVNANQQLSIDSGIGAYRINYKYGLVKSFFNNIYLQSTPRIFPLKNIVDEWTIASYTYLDFPVSNEGLILSGETRGQQDLIITSDVVSLIEGNRISYRGAIEHTFSGTNFGTALFRCKVILTDGTSTRYMNKNGQWDTSNIFILFSEVKYLGSFNYEIISDTLPFDGDAYIELYTPNPTSFGTDYDVTYLVSQNNLTIADNELEDIKGENHTFQFNTTDFSTKIEDVKEVFNGDSISDVYIGTIYQSDEVTPTELWNRGNVRKIALLQYSGEERMAMYSKPLRVFSGDIFGFVDYLSVFEIDGITDVKFMPIEYSYDALTNTTKIKLKQILNDAGGLDYNDVDYTPTFDYGNVVEPTIK